MNKRKPKQKVLTVNIEIPVDMRDISGALLRLDQEDVFNFIVQIDKDHQDWGVTERLATYFVDEMSKLYLDEPEYNAPWVAFLEGHVSKIKGK